MGGSGSWGDSLEEVTHWGGKGAWLGPRRTFRPAAEGIGGSVRDPGVLGSRQCGLETA